VMKNDWDENYREKLNTHFMLCIFFSENRVICEIM
jgi:hypothetical protein